MDPTGSPRPGGRVSRLPVPRAGLRPVASRDNLQKSASRLTISNPRLRNAPSKDQLHGSAPSEEVSSRQNNRTSSNGTVVYAPNGPARKASSSLLRKTPDRIDTMGEAAGQEDTSRLDEFELPPLSKPSPPSLSERTMETLQNIPSSPVVRQRNSSFFSPDSPMRAPSESSRPGSSYQSDTSMGPPTRSASSRPTSSSSNDKSNAADFRASTNSTKPVQNIRIPKSRPGHATSQVSSPTIRASIRQRSPSPAKTPASLALKSGSKTLSSRPLKPRASVNGLFRKPSMSGLDGPSDVDKVSFVTKKTSNFSNTTSEIYSVVSRGTAATSNSPDRETTPRKSSSALREQIAKAKAAKRAASGSKARTSFSSTGDSPVIADGSFDFGLSDDPFNQGINKNDSKGLLRKRIDAARTDGRLNIAAMGLKEVPQEVKDMYNLESLGQDVSWAESVDLIRFIAADNEFEEIGDDVFPDIDAREAQDSDEAQGNQFGGLQTLDLHGNMLGKLPIGLRRLEFLTSLNLSNNKLDNDSLEIISQIASLRDVKLVANELSGPLDERITRLSNLEVLDIRQNALTVLPDGLTDLVRLRILNIADNRFSSLPFELLRQLPLIEILAAKNSLSGVLIAGEVDELPQLQVLDVTGNALTSIAGADKIRLPMLHQLSCSSNRLTCLPEMTSWISLLTLIAEDNKIASLPDGFVALPKVKNVDLSGNNIKVLDDRIGAMDSLDVFRVSGNPLKDRKFAGMATDDLKRALKARMEPPEDVSPAIEKESDDGEFLSAAESPLSASRPSSDWAVKPGGILDRSNTKSYSLNPVAIAQVAAKNTIKALELHHNAFKEIPSSIEFFASTLTTLSLAHNELTSDTFLQDELDLPALKELNLSSNTFDSLQPLIQRLRAPQLEKLDISFNRLTSLPVLRTTFPNLWTLLVSNNTIRELSPEAVKGLKVLDCSSNELNSLNARIGLLGGPGGLERLNVSGNRFRVPKYTILEKGTEATLTWLRDRIPADELASIETN